MSELITVAQSTTFELKRVEAEDEGFLSTHIIQSNFAFDDETLPQLIGKSYEEIETYISENTSEGIQKWHEIISTTREAIVE